MKLILLKVVPNCSNIHKNLGGSKIYKSPQCGHPIPRDINGDRNINVESFVGLGELPSMLSMILLS
ncbi:MAG: hypothetical protein O4805_01355 [Trichodesmium sp. St16_bin2-tuft]|nr:hypothetical protein [Trichodesmium sp. St18_bin1]MDE5085860.1 hypothetical protein [Trichodesmium sp. St16_bin2-tuft]